MMMDLSNQSKEELVKLVEELSALEEYKKYHQLEFLFPLAEHKGYGKHMEFFKAGAKYKERALIAANRSGKTFSACSEMAWHLTGLYPDWWVGRKFDHPVAAWSVGKTHETTRDILQKYLLGPRYDMGSGFIPKASLVRTTTKPGIPDAIQDVYIKHYTLGLEDGVSTVSFKSYVQGIEAFMGTQQDLIHLDEEPMVPGLYSECLTRTMTTQGLIMCTFTPLEGMSEVVLSFLPDGRFPEGGIGEVVND